MATFTVTTLIDENDGGASVTEPGSAGLSLREAVTLANANAGADRIEFAEGLSGLMRMAQSQINIRNDALEIDGGGRITISGDIDDNDKTIAGDISTLAGNGTAELSDNVRAFFVREGADTTLIGLTLTGGRTRNEGGHGGVVYSQADLTIIDSVIRGNSTSADNAMGGGVFSRTDITLIDSIVTNNSTRGERSYGGGVGAEGLLTITSSEVYGNLTVGRFSDGGGAFSEGGAVVSGSNISNNSVTGNFAADGGGLAARGALTLTNSTVAYNQVDSYRGYGGGIRVEGDATISHSTIVGNSVSEEPTFSQRNAGPSVVFEADLTVNNSIIVGNVGPTADEPELGAYLPYREYELTFTGLNIIGASADQFDASALDTVINADPDDVFVSGGDGFGFNGGSVRTIALSADPDNPALDTAAGDDVQDIDARGVPGAGARDLGAYERITDANLIVTTTEDVLDATDGLLSLREAVYFANVASGPNTITFAPEAGGVIRLTEGALLIFDDLTIDGGGSITITGDANGDDVVNAQGVTDVAASGADLLGDNSSIIYSVNRESTLTVDGLTLTGGRIEFNYFGGGAINSQGDLNILNSTVAGNSTGGEYSSGGGIFASNTVTVMNSTIAGNSTAGTSGRGGGIFSTRDVVVTNSTISGNSTSGDISDGGGIFAFRDATVTGSTITGNSTAASNAEGGGVFAGADTVGGGTLTVANSIVLGNVASSAEGDELFKDTSSSANDGLIEVNGANIIGSNSAAFDVPAQTTGGGSAQNAAATAVFAATTDNNGVRAGLLADSGGPVQTIALRVDKDNPALDASSNTAPDARGLPRVDLDFLDNGGVADLGAFELQDQILFAPSFTIGSAFVVAENVTNVGTITASDDGEGILFAITGGADAAFFAINAVSGALTFSAPPDFEAPGDANRNNIYLVTVRATDNDGISTEQTFSVTVTDVADTPSTPTGPIGPTNDDDTLVGTAQSDRIDALGGDDNVTGQAGDDLLFGRDGDDSIRGSTGDDSLRGNGGADTLKGNGGDDDIKGNGGADLIRGNGGMDQIRAGGGIDDVNGGGGADTILGNGGADQLNGGGGADLVNGGGGADLVNGGGGADDLRGGGGADTLRGNGGNDTLTGNGGADVFQFSTSDRNDTITDFRQGQDRIEIQNGAQSFQALEIEQDGRDVLIGFGAGQVRVVTDSAEAFDDSDFIF